MASLVVVVGLVGLLINHRPVGLTQQARHSRWSNRRHRSRSTSLTTTWRCRNLCTIRRLWRLLDPDQLDQVVDPHQHQHQGLQLRRRQIRTRQSGRRGCRRREAPRSGPRTAAAAVMDCRTSSIPCSVSEFTHSPHIPWLRKERTFNANERVCSRYEVLVYENRHSLLRYIITQSVGPTKKTRDNYQ